MNTEKPKETLEPGSLVNPNRAIFSWKSIIGWDSIGWCVALFIGIWGVLIATADFAAANGLFIAAAVVASIKFGHVTQIHRSTRKIIPFLLSVVVVVTLTGIELYWAHAKSDEAAELKKQLATLASMPDLQKQVSQIPALNGRVAALAQQNKAAMESLASKESTIEGLAKVVISQQNTFAESAHKDVSQATLSINKNINQYRTDTSSAVSKLLRPDRTLGKNKQPLIELLKASGPHEIAITPARGNRESIAYSEEIESAFRSAGWTIVPTQKLAFIIRDAIGLGLVTKLYSGEGIPLTDLTPGQAAVARAFGALGMALSPNPQARGEEGPTELYVGLQ